MQLILFAIWFFLPAGLANGAPVIANKIPFIRDFKLPMDFGKSWRRRRIFGDNKTWRGLLSGVVAGILVIYLQSVFVKNFGGNFILEVHPDYYSILVGDIWRTLLLGGLLGFGALFGDAIESSIKRQLNVTAGDPWFPFDQIDFIIGGLMACYPLIVFDLRGYLLITVVWFSLHIISSYLGFLSNLKERPI